jgi:hypothetical protein
MPFRPPTFRLARCLEVTLAASKIVKNGDAPRPQSCPFASRCLVDLSEIYLVTVGSRGLSSLNWLRSSLPFSRGSFYMFQRA